MLVAFFQEKGLKAIKEEDQREAWYQDWIDYQSKHQLYASLLSPKKYSTLGHHLDLRRLTRFLEAFSYCSPAHTYSLHVTFLGLFPILMSANEPLKKEAIARLEAGGLFGFAVSEKAHGADLFANEFNVKTVEPLDWVANGTKYYIGNANAACMLSVLARKTEADESSTSPNKRSPFVFFAIRPAEAPAYQDVRKIHTVGIRNAFVGEFTVKGHHFAEGDMISQGREAWNALFATVTLGKFFLGFGAIGICSHAFAESIEHLRKRILYGQSVMNMPHIRGMVALAFARLTAMKLFAYRAMDYLQVSNKDDRRYLLWNAVQKAKVSTEGVKVIAQLFECIGAHGTETQTYFETASRDIHLIPALEGSTHINFDLATQFIDAYFSSNGGEVSAPRSLMNQGPDVDENPYWLESRNRTPSTVRFADYLSAYEPLQSVDNVLIFREQVEAFRLLAQVGVSSLNPALDVGLSVELGKCISTIAYAQLVVENCVAMEVPLATVSVIFHGLIEDLSVESLKLSAMFAAGSRERTMLVPLVRIAETRTADMELLSAFVAARYQGL